MTSTDKKRLHYLDNLKVFLIILVVVHHVGQAYGSTGGTWFYSYPGERVKPLVFFFLFNASFFMGLFFFISAYFLPGSFDRHGARKFVTDKFIRFGIPLAFSSLIMMPFIDYVRYVNYVDPVSFKDFYIRHWFGYGAGTASQFTLAHLWFIEHLLIYSILYAALRTVRQRWAPSVSSVAPLRVRLWGIIAYILILGLVTDLVRNSLGFPVNRWTWFLGFMLVEPAHIPQYASLFFIGILAYRRSFLESIAAPRNMLWLVPAIGIYGATIIRLYTADYQRAFSAWEFKEALFCVGICIGLLALFKAFCNRTGRIMQTLSENTFGVYILHVPIVVALQYAFDPVQADAFTLFIVVSLLSIPGAFLVSFLIRLIPGMKRVL